MNGDTKAGHGAMKSVPTGAVLTVHRLGRVRGGVAIMNAHTGSGESTTVGVGKKISEVREKPRESISPGLFSCKLRTLRDSSRSSVSLTRS
jgi:hypothetical protein